MIPGWVHTGMTAAAGTPKPPGAWDARTGGGLHAGTPCSRRFLHPLPDNDVTRALDERRIAWMAGDVIENRPALSRWHPDWADAFRASIADL